ncbi:hypothetical protein ANACOL_01742 [Anaerotruncus colihominis DSM 17241]|uniref:Uncharacterized protein n=1 Tax=Anaerotruncus colihominis DSM 17241 TaxID=445972 RepID=B0PAE3_9FIRM|nr:hypothetical protein ANACOL_01742 [Anaerotruncus colihominis DSM 17241]
MYPHGFCADNCILLAYILGYDKNMINIFSPAVNLTTEIYKK